jgi:hypothetical protein
MAICCDNCKKIERNQGWERRIEVRFEDNGSVYDALFCSWDCAENFCRKERWKLE